MVRILSGTFPKGTAIPGVAISLAKSKAHDLSLASYIRESQKYVDSVAVLRGVLIKDFHLNGWMSANKNVKIMIVYDNFNIRELSEVSLEAGPSSCRDMRVFMFTCRWLSRFRDRMNQDDKAFGQQLLRVILANPQLQTAIGLYLPLSCCFHPPKQYTAQAICPRAVTALLQNEQFKTGCIQQVALTFEQNQVIHFIFVTLISYIDFQ